MGYMAISHIECITPLNHAQISIAKNLKRIIEGKFLIKRKKKTKKKVLFVLVVQERDRKEETRP